MEEEKLTVTIKTGKVLGKEDVDHYGKKYISFRGIPYGKPPIGLLRFKAPQPAEKWNNTLDCTNEGEACFGPLPLGNDFGGTEDCLLLNVYTPELPNEKKQARAVMVFIHGGGFTSGSGQSFIYGPQFLINHDIVLVTINYRTGILGFLSMEDPKLGVPGNAGLKDMVLALKWVQSNIKQFNGDPKNVTIFGESAGAASVHALILTPLAKGLFHKAIPQSGCALNGWAMGGRIAHKIAAFSGFESADERATLHHLQSLPVKELYEACTKLKDAYLVGRVRPFTPVVETSPKNAIFDKNPEDIIKSGKYNKVPILMGHNSGEGMLISSKAGTKIRSGETLIPWTMHLRKGSPKYQETMNKILQFYFKGEPYDENNEKHIDILIQLYSHNTFVYEILKSVELHRKTSSTPIYYYKFDLDTELNYIKHLMEVDRPGACHADDICYLFKSMATPEIQPNSIADISIRRMTKLWTNFAKFGNPTPDQNDKLLNVVWSPISNKKFCYLEIKEKLQMKTDPEKKFYDFWKTLYQENQIPTSKL